MVQKCPATTIGSPIVVLRPGGDRAGPPEVTQPESAAVVLTRPDDLWRIKIGDYRVVYAIEDDRLVVLIVRVVARGAVYCGL